MSAHPDHRADDARPDNERRGGDTAADAVVDADPDENTATDPPATSGHSDASTQTRRNQEDESPS